MKSKIIFFLLLLVCSLFPFFAFGDEYSKPKKIWEYENALKKIEWYSWKQKVVEKKEEKILYCDRFDFYGYEKFGFFRCEGCLILYSEKKSLSEKSADSLIGKYVSNCMTIDDVAWNELKGKVSGRGDFSGTWLCDHGEAVNGLRLISNHLFYPSRTPPEN